MVHALKPHIFSEGFYRAQKIPYILYIIGIGENAFTYTAFGCYRKVNFSNFPE